jgi:hypothetical protein
MDDEEDNGQDQQDMDEGAHDVKGEKRKDPDDIEKSGKDKERVAHGSPRPHAITI